MPGCGQRWDADRPRVVCDQRVLAHDLVRDQHRRAVGAHADQVRERRAPARAVQLVPVRDADRARLEAVGQRDRPPVRRQRVANVQVGLHDPDVDAAAEAAGVAIDVAFGPRIEVAPVGIARTGDEGELGHGVVQSEAFADDDSPHPGRATL